MKKESFFPIKLIIALLRDDQESHGLISRIAWGTCGAVCCAVQLVILTFETVDDQMKAVERYVSVEPVSCVSFFNISPE